MTKTLFLKRVMPTNHKRQCLIGLLLIFATTVAGCQKVIQLPPAIQIPTPTPQCVGRFAFALGEWKSADLYIAPACQSISYRLPDDAGPVLDGWVECDFSWSPNGRQLAYSSNYYYSGHGEIRVIDPDSGTIRVLTPSFALLDTTTGSLLREYCYCNENGCTDKAYGRVCEPATVIDGQVMFINSRQPVWSPDGTQIVFQSMYFDLSSDATVPTVLFRYFQIESDGSNIVSLTDQEADSLLSWWLDQKKSDGPPPPFLYQFSNPAYRLDCDAVWHP